MTAPCPRDGCPYSVDDQCTMIGCPGRFPRKNPVTGSGYSQLLPVNCAGASASAAFPFIGTAGEHLARVEREIQRKREIHAALRHLLKRQRILKARCAALGVQA